MIKRVLDYFHPLEVLRRKREQYLSVTKLTETQLNLIKSEIPEPTDLAKDVDFIVLDIETTGFDSQSDLILSMGWVSISNNMIDLTSAKHLYLNNDSQINAETAVINHIIPQMLAEGVSIHDAMMTFFEEAKGKVIVAHACVMEENFINQYMQRCYRLAPLPLLWLDTLCLEKNMAKVVNNHRDVDLTLASTRERYGLPEYNSHNALADAVSTAELLLAQQKRLSPNTCITIGNLYRKSK
ncbi:3'-5' exonuclease [Psychromonas sp. KJ10-10]|uniref:3'-5' exonuclease n=1 Tax=Psychromonas sp. KJ10-10 TaxID=3391823 RepID=UPI0039B65122